MSENTSSENVTPNNENGATNSPNNANARDTKKQKQRHAHQQEHVKKSQNSHESEKLAAKAPDPSTASSTSAQRPTANPAKAPTSKLAAIALLVSLIACGGIGGLYLHEQSERVNLQHQFGLVTQDLNHVKQNTQQDAVKLLQNEQSKQNQRLDTIQQNMANQIAKNGASLSQLENQTQSTLKAQEQAIHALQEKLSAMSTTDSQVWLISQADYLVKLAGRKIWQDNDFATAQLLLKSADLSLAETNDPSLLPARQSITQDIASLAAVNQIDFDGIVLELTQLANRVSALALKQQKSDIDLRLLSGDEHDDQAPVSESVSDWKANLRKNWNAFLSKFITIKKRDQFDVCQKDNLDEQTLQSCHALKGLVAPEQQTYVRENIRLQLLIAAQAVPRHNNDVYRESLMNVETWIKAYFDLNNANTSAFIQDLNTLKAKSISTQYVPERFKSAPVLEKLMQQRVRALLTQQPAAGE